MIDFLSLALPTLADNLALDEALLLDAEAGASCEVLRLWHWPSRVVVLGAGGIIDDDVNVSACENDGVPLARRASGGGTVLLGPGCLLFSLVLRMDRAAELAHIGASYRFILGRIAEALGDLQPGIEFSGTSDLAVAGRKFSGNAQQRKRHFLLHHGTLLHAFDLGVVGRYLTLPPRRPAYRADRPHRDFLMNLPDRSDAITERLRRAWDARRERTNYPAELVRQLVAEKYSQAEWVRRR
jgi:lipoate-protein ligase A